MAVSAVMGHWRPLAGADPFSGKPGELSREVEMKVEFACAAALMPEAVATIRRIHPYEEPVIHVMLLQTP